MIYIFSHGSFVHVHVLFIVVGCRHSYDIIELQFFIFCMSGTKLKDFLAALPAFQSETAKLRHDVEEYAKQFPTIGFEKESMKYKN